MKIIPIKVTRTEGQTYPVWYYGFSYTDYYREVKVYHILPFNFFVRWFLIIRRSYQRMRLLPWDVEMRHISREAREKGYYAGYANGFKDSKRLTSLGL